MNKLPYFAPSLVFAIKCHALKPCLETMTKPAALHSQHAIESNKSINKHYTFMILGNIQTYLIQHLSQQAYTIHHPTCNIKHTKQLGNAFTFIHHKQNQPNTWTSHPTKIFYRASSKVLNKFPNMHDRPATYIANNFISLPCNLKITWYHKQTCIIQHCIIIQSMYMHGRPVCDIATGCISFPCQPFCLASSYHITTP